AAVMLSESAKDGDAILRIDLGAKGKPATVEGGLQPFRITTAAASNEQHRLFGPEGRWAVVFRTARTVPDVAAASEFVTAQVRDALGAREALTKADLEQDAGLSGLREMFRYADRDGDDRMTLAELEAHLKLVEEGVKAQVWVRVFDCGRNPFPFLDADGDGRLSYRELIRTVDLLPKGAKEAAG